MCLLCVNAPEPVSGHDSNINTTETAKIARLNANSRSQRTLSFESFMPLLHDPTGSRTFPTERCSRSKTGSGRVSVHRGWLHRAGTGQVERVT